MLSTHCCSCLYIFVLGSWKTTEFQFPKLNFTFSYFHLEAFYWFFTIEFHTLADPEVWVERGALAYSFTISGSITGFSNLGQIFYQIQSDSNHSLMHITEAVHLHQVHILNGNTLENRCSQTEWFAQEIQVWHEAKNPIQIHESWCSFLSTNWCDITHAEQLGISLTLWIRNCEHIVTAFSSISTANPKTGMGEKERRQRLVTLWSIFSRMKFFPKVK